MSLWNAQHSPPDSPVGRAKAGAGSNTSNDDPGPMPSKSFKTGIGDEEDSGCCEGGGGGGGGGCVSSGGGGSGNNANCCEGGGGGGSGVEDSMSCCARQAPTALQDWQTSQLHCPHCQMKLSEILAQQMPQEASPTASTVKRCKLGHMFARNQDGAGMA